MENLIKDLISICRQYGHKVDAINPSIDSDGKILDLTIFMEDDSEDIFMPNFPVYRGEQEN